MRLSQSRTRALSSHVFLTITIIILITLLPPRISATVQQLTCSRSSLRFGGVPVGQTETQIVVLTNSGQSSVTISAVSRTGSRIYSVPVEPSPDSFRGAEHRPEVTFSPVATGWTGGSAILASNASNPDLRLELAGGGVISDAVTAAPSIVSFGKVAVGASSTLSVGLTNARRWRVKLSALQTTGSGFSVTGPALPMILGGGRALW
jgi:hypothetical protein